MKRINNASGLFTITCLTLIFHSCIKYEPTSNGQKTIDKSILAGDTGRTWDLLTIAIEYYTTHISQLGMDSLVLDSVIRPNFTGQFFHFTSGSLAISDSLASIMELPQQTQWEVYENDFKMIYLNSYVLKVENYYRPSPGIEETLWITLSKFSNGIRTTFILRFVPRK